MTLLKNLVACQTRKKIFQIFITCYIHVNINKSLLIQIYSLLLQNAKAELESCLEVIDALKEKENEYLTLINDYEKEKEHYTEHV